MRLPVDDETYNVNAIWLGPSGKTLPFRARYVAYAIQGVHDRLEPFQDRQRGRGVDAQAAQHGR